MADVVTVIQDNRVVVEVAGADLASAIATAAVAEMAAQVASDLQEIQEIASGAPDAPSILNKLNKDGDNADAGLLANIGAVASADLADDTGAELVGYGNRTLADRLLDTSSIKDAPFNAVGDGVANDTAAFQAAATYAALNRAYITIPSGDYLVDEFVFPWQGSFAPKARGGFRGVGSARILARANSRILCRVSDTFIDVDGLTFVPNSKTGCTAIGVVPEDRAQTTTKVSQSYFSSMGCTVEGDPSDQFAEGIIFQPGPTVGGGDSGCFYFNIYNWNANTVTCHVRFYQPSTPNNSVFVTRTNFYGGSFLNGNCAVYADGVGDVNFYGTNIELINAGTSPVSTPTAVYVPSNAPLTYAQHIYMSGGYIEASTRGIHNDSPNSYIVTDGTVYPTPTGNFANNVSRRTSDRVTLYGAQAGATVDMSVDGNAVVREIIDPSGLKATRSRVWRLGSMDVGGFTPYLKADPGGLGGNAWHEVGTSNSGARIINFAHGDDESPRGIQVTFPNYTAGEPRNFFMARWADAVEDKAFIWDNGDLVLSGTVQMRPQVTFPTSQLANGDVAFQFASNTSLTIFGKGTDGTVRSVVLTLA